MLGFKDLVLLLFLVRRIPVTPEILQVSGDVLKTRVLA